MLKDRWWLRYYVTFSPVGALIAAVIILGFARAWPPWGSRDHLELFGALVTLGLACYGAVVWILELVGEGVLRAVSEFNARNKNRKKKFLMVLARSGALNLSAISTEQLRELGLEEADVKDLRGEEPVSV